METLNSKQFEDILDMHWKLTIILVCAFGIIKEFRPATPFLTPYLITHPKNFTNVQLYSEIYPFWTYSYFVALIPSLFLTDFLRYKPVVVLEAVTLCATWILLIWGKTVWQMQIMQIMFGIASACELGYESYMFLIVDFKYYVSVSSYTRAATQIGRFFAYALAQFLVSFNYGSYLLLNQISFVAVCLTIPIALCFPPVTVSILRKKECKNADLNVIHSIFSERSTSLEQCDPSHCRITSESSQSANISAGILKYFRATCVQFTIFTRNKNVLKWSMWWALTTCGVYQVMNYIQTLWATMQVLSETYNGITECANTFIGAAISFSVQYVHLDWKENAEIILALTSGIIAVLLVIMPLCQSITPAYILYVGVIAIYNFLMTAACAAIASELDSASYAFVFGINTFIALSLESSLTLIVADKHGFALSIQKQVFLIFLSIFNENI
ncbi:unnamed protein product [Thelazia callipaeda]|uniref:Thiamine transporter 1 n=1 Tax=Thelazia callipaeda TaxID=103827 RepID=A0A0N5DBL6_THECL|nr:unnamed protein product [Thelazia callipaeda]